MTSKPPADSATLRLREESPDAGLRAEWEALAYETGAGFFKSPQWVEAWRAAYAPDAEVVVLTARDGDGALHGLLPLAEMTRALHRRLPLPLRYLGVAGAGAGSGDHLGPVATSPDLAGQLLRYAATLRPSLPALFESVGPDPDEIEGAVTKQDVCPTITLVDVDGRKDLWSSKFRKNLRRAYRKAEAEGLAVAWYPPGDEGRDASRDVLRQIGALHIARQQTLGRSGLFDERRLALVAALAEADFRGDDGQWVATLNDEAGRVRAGLIGFQYGDAFYEYKTGWDPELRDVAPGKLLKTASIERAIERDLVLYDLLRGTETYKYRYGGVDRADTTFLVPRGLRGRLLRLRERFDAPSEDRTDHDSDD